MMPLSQATEALYAAFSSWPLRPQVSVCPCCFTREEERSLHAAPLRALPAEVISGPAQSALLTWGDLADAKWVLPRVFELAAEGAFSWPDLEVSLALPHRGDWRRWPAAEQAAVEAWFHALWADLLSRWPAPHDVGTVLCALAQSLDDLTPWLEVWEALPGDAPVWHLSGVLWREGHHFVTRGTLRNAFWEARHAPQLAQLGRWLRRPSLRARVEAAFFAGPPPEREVELSAALAFLEALALSPAAPDAAPHGK
jgi:hypothetical protein